MIRNHNTDDDSSLHDLEGTDGNKLEYIKGMISVVREDIKIIMLYISFSLGIILLFLTQISLEKILTLCLLARILVFTGIVFLSLCAVCFFIYIRNLHITQMRMTRCIASLNALRTRELWAGENGVWEKHRYKYYFGKFFMVCGIVSFGIVLFYILIINK